MRTDVEPFYSLALANGFHGLVSVSTLHKICMYSGLVGAVIYYVVNHYVSRRNKALKHK